MEKKWLILAVTAALIVSVAVGSFLVFGNKKSIEAMTAEKAERKVALHAGPSVKETLNAQIITIQNKHDEQKEAADEDLLNQLTAAQQNAEALHKQLETATQENETLRAEIENAQAALSAAQQEKDELNEQLAKAAETEKTLAAEKEALQADLTAAQTILAAAQQETEVLKAQATASDKSLNGQLVKAQQEKDELNEQLAKAAETEKTLTAEKDALQADLATAQTALTAANQDAEEQKKQTAASIEALNSQLAIAQQEKDELNEQLAKAAETEKTLTAEKEALQADLSAAQAALTAANQDAEEQKKQTAASIEALNSQLAIAQQEKDALNGQLAKAAEAEKTLTGQLAAAAQEKETLSAQIIALKQDWADTQDKLTAETEKADQLAQTLVRLLVGLSAGQDGEASLGVGSVTNVRHTMGLEKNAARSLGLPVEDGDSSGAAMTVNGEAVTKKELDDALDFELLLHQYLQNGESPADREEIKDQTIRTLAENRVLWQQAEAAGLTSITDKERKSLEETAAHLESEYGLPENSTLPGLFASRVLDRLWDDFGFNEPVSEAEYTQALEQKKQENWRLIRNDPEAFARLLETDIQHCYIVPAGYRFVKHIFLPVELGEYKRVQEKIIQTEKLLKKADNALILANNDGDAAEIAAKKQEKEAIEETLAALQAEWAVLEPSIQAAQQIIAQINRSIKDGTADVDALIAQYSADKDMPSAGYAVCESSSHPSPALAKTGMVLYAEGTWSTSIEMEDGYHLLYYSKDLTRSKENLAASYALLREEMNAAKRMEAAESTIAGWVAKADIRMAE